VRAIFLVSDPVRAVGGMTSPLHVPDSTRILSDPGRRIDPVDPEDEFAITFFPFRFRVLFVLIVLPLSIRAVPVQMISDPVYV
jgi:hypothetical protein